MHWILLIYMYGGYNDSSPAVAGVEFGTKDACIFASKVLKGLPGDYAPAPRAICVPKG